MMESHNHAIGLNYHAETRAWQLMNSNEGEPHTYDLEEMAERLLDGFNIPRKDPRNEFTAFSTEVIVSAELTQLELLKINMNEFASAVRSINAQENAQIFLREGEVNLLWQAAKIGDLKTVRNCIRLCTPSQLTSLVSGKNGYIPLSVAAQHGHLEVVHELLKVPGIQINQTTEKGSTPLRIATLFGHIDVVQALLGDSQCDVNHSGHGSDTPLYGAIHEGNLEIVSALLNDARTDVNAIYHGVTPLFLAAQEGKLDMVQLLLGDKRCEVNQPNQEGATPLFMAIQQGHPEIVSALLNDPRTDVNASYHGVTPLFLAAQEGKLDMVQALIEDKRCDINQPGPNGLTPLHMAAGRRYLETVKILLTDPKINANATLDECTPLDLALHEGYSDIVEVLERFLKTKWETTALTSLPSERYKVRLRVMQGKSIEDQALNASENGAGEQKTPDLN